MTCLKDAGHGKKAVGREQAADARKLGGGNNGSDAQRAVEDAVAERALLEVAAGDDGEERPDGRDEEAIGEGADERRLQLRRVADEAKAAADGAGDAL